MPAYLDPHAGREWRSEHHGATCTAWMCADDSWRASIRFDIPLRRHVTDSAGDMAGTSIYAYVRACVKRAIVLAGERRPRTVTLECVSAEHPMDEPERVSSLYFRASLDYVIEDLAIR